LEQGDRGVCWERRKAYTIEEQTEKLVVKNQHTRVAENTFAKQVEDGSFRDERKRTRGGGGGERKKKICITTHIKALAPMKNKDSSSSSSPWVLSAELQNLSANQTWYNNICSNHGM
jgi:hypothetical protein